MKQNVTPYIVSPHNLDERGNLTLHTAAPVQLCNVLLQENRERKKFNIAGEQEIHSIRNHPNVTICYIKKQ